MIAFLDFEASSLARRSYPIEVAWVFEDGAEETHLIRPAPDWVDWDPQAEAIHGITRGELVARGEPHGEVAQRMVAALTGHDLYASAPSWDGKWLSVLLRAGGLQRKALRLRDTDELLRQSAKRILEGAVPEEMLTPTVDNLLALAELRANGAVPVHRALADAQEERQRWIAMRDAAMALARSGG